MGLDVQRKYNMLVKCAGETAQQKADRAALGGFDVGSAVTGISGTGPAPLPKLTGTTVAQQSWDANYGKYPTRSGGAGMGAPKKPVLDWSLPKTTVAEDNAMRAPPPPAAPEFNGTQDPHSGFGKQSKPAGAGYYTKN